MKGRVGALFGRLRLGKGQSTNTLNNEGFVLDFRVFWEKLKGRWEESLFLNHPTKVIW
jgi:chromosome condensin MukBEF MukE localization factor